MSLCFCQLSANNIDKSGSSHIMPCAMLAVVHISSINDRPPASHRQRTPTAGRICWFPAVATALGPPTITYQTHGKNIHAVDAGGASVREKSFRQDMHISNQHPLQSIGLNESILDGL